MAQPRPQSRNKLHSALLDIYRDMRKSGKTLEQISIANYSRKYNIRNFAKRYIAEMMKKPYEPNINDATELARLLSYNVIHTRVNACYEHKQKCRRNSSLCIGVSRYVDYKT